MERHRNTTPPLTDHEIREGARVAGAPAAPVTVNAIAREAAKLGAIPCGARERQAVSRWLRDLEAHGEAHRAGTVPRDASTIGRSPELWRIAASALETP